MDYFDALFYRNFGSGGGSGGTIETPVPISKGGTSGVTADAARTNLDLYSTSEVDALLNGKADTTDIPTDLNQLSNAITQYVNETQLKNAIDKLGSVFSLKGSVSTVNDLPNTGNTIGDVYYVQSVNSGYAWINDNGVYRWLELGNTIDTSDFLTKSGLLTSTGNSTTNTMTQDAITTELNGKANANDIPVYTSDLINNSNFVSSTSLSPVSASGSYTDLSDTPTQITDFGGTLPISRGGTGATTAATARANLGVMAGTTLYSNSSGSTGTIILFSDYASFKEIYIEYKDSYGIRDSTTFSPNATQAAINIPYVNSAINENVNAIYFRTAFATFSGNTITIGRNGTSTLHFSSDDTWVWGEGSKIAIVKVIGYK